MKSEIKEVSPTQKEIHIEIDGEALKEAYGRVSKKYSQRANVPGFGKGTLRLTLCECASRK